MNDWQLRIFWCIKVKNELKQQISSMNIAYIEDEFKTSKKQTLNIC